MKIISVEKEKKRYRIELGLYLFADDPVEFFKEVTRIKNTLKESKAVKVFRFNLEEENRFNLGEEQGVIMFSVVREAKE